MSAERSEAREDDVGRRATSRVASPLVMAAHGRESRFSDLRWARCGDSHVKPLPPASQGGSATRHDQLLPHRLLRLRCAPPSTMSSEIHARASKGGHLKRSFSSPLVASAQTAAQYASRSSTPLRTCQYSSSIGAWRPKMVTSTRTRPFSGRTSSISPS